MKKAINLKEKDIKMMVVWQALKGGKGRGTYNYKIILKK